ncbi:MAG: hypothetical protein J2P48_24620, partial [Alphaproteobacteria bacterium]|nr:hypothetical protein [Alphaproteobacteria bacterium]
AGNAASHSAASEASINNSKRFGCDDIFRSPVRTGFSTLARHGTPRGECCKKLAARQGEVRHGIGEAHIRDQV